MFKDLKKEKKKSYVCLPDPDKFCDIKKYEDALLSLDSITFDEYIKKVNGIKKIEDKDKLFIKDIKRKIKNRESARKSRRCRKSKIDVLQSKVSILNNENVALKSEMKNLKQENTNLKGEVNYWRENFGKDTSKGLSTQNLILFVILFSFGMLWNLDLSRGVSYYFEKSNDKVYDISSVFEEYVEDPLLDKLLNGETEENYYSKNMRERKKPKDVEVCC